jgi:hypothetical protein
MMGWKMSISILLAFAVPTATRPSASLPMCAHAHYILKHLEKPIRGNTKRISGSKTYS